MKIAIFGESSTDDAVIKILAQAIIGEEIEFISAPRLEIRDTKRGGSANMYKHLRNFFRYWYYYTEAEYLIMIIDSDDTPIHQIEHEEEGKENEKCRLCALRQNIKKIQSEIPPLENRKQIKTAIGLAVPAIEAWFRCMKDSHIAEATWSRKLLSNEQVGYDRPSLKEDFYGSGRDEKTKKEKAEEEAKKLTNNLEQLEELFPQGFGCLVRDIKSW